MGRTKARTWVAVAAFAVLAGVACRFVLWRDPGEPPRLEETRGKIPAPVPTIVPGAPAYSPLADELHAERFDAAHDLMVLRGLLGQLTTSLRLAERPPLGDNADITAALMGRNRRRIVFVPATHPAVRGGRLVDRQGEPYHFHARSADAVDVRSAGPDRILFTSDDLASAPP
jgi:hypothetical protein